MSNGNGHITRTELKEELGSLRAELRGEITALGDRLADLIASLGHRMDERFDALHARLDRQGGLLRSGQTNLVRLNDWSEKMDQMLVIRDKRIEELEARLRKLEERNR